MTPHDHPPRPARRSLRASRFPLRTLWVALFACVALASAGADEPGADTGSKMVQLDFQNAELTDVIDTIAKLTKTNFIYDDRVRGRVTIISPTPVPIEQAYAVFESVLQVKGFTTVKTPGGALKVIPLREAKETSVETSRSTAPPRNRDTFITRLIPLRYIESESIVNTLKPLVSKDAAIASYAPTNTVILTESASNIRRIIAILESIDIETYREEIAVLRIEFADASTMASQIAEIFGATVTAAVGRTGRANRRGAKPAPTAARAAGELGKVRIITDERTNALIVLAPRTQLEEVRRLVHKLDVPVTGGGRIHVYYLQHADAEELAQTLSSMISGRGRAPAAATGQGGAAQAIRAQVAGLASGISVTADPATNSLVIQASKEGFNTISAVIAKLDVARPQVLVEALIMEVLVNDSEELGFNGMVKIMQGDNEYVIELATDAATNAFLGGAPSFANLAGVGDLIGSAFVPDASGTTIQAILRLAAKDASTNIISAPHILTSDNEEAEIRIGDNIPIVSSRVQSAQGVVGSNDLATSVNVERQDIGVTLRVTPQITEGDTLRLDIFQEITNVNTTLQDDVGPAADVGVALSSRRVENTVVVGDGETVVIGGLIGESYQDTVDKVPWLGDIPFLGWLFKTTSRKVIKKNLLVFLTPHIIRTTDDLEKETIRKRQEFVDRNKGGLRLSEREQAWERREMQRAAAAGEPYEPGRGLNPVRHAVLDHEGRYPVERMREIEQFEREAAERAAQEPKGGPTYFLQAGLYADEDRAIEVLTEVLDLGFDGALLTADRAGALLYEVRVGPYETLEDARLGIHVLERAHDLSPSVLVEEAPAP